jgi:hypothetical protein
MRLTEELGRAVGALWSPAVRLGTKLRHARLFHPEGVVYSARVLPLPVRPGLRPVAERLAGSALVRLSSALWRGGREWPDILGMAVRLSSGDTPTEEASPGDQDLLFATLRFPWTLGLAPLSTDTRDWLENDYYAVSPFEVEGLGRAKLRVTSSRAATTEGESREERLESARQSGQARFLLEVRPSGGESAGTWLALAELRLVEPVTLDASRLRFYPYRTGRGIRPVGFIHALRIPTYRQGQATRAADAAST